MFTLFQSKRVAYLVSMIKKLRKGRKAKNLYDAFMQGYIHFCYTRLHALYFLYSAIHHLAHMHTCTHTHTLLSTLTTQKAEAAVFAAGKV